MLLQVLHAPVAQLPLPSSSLPAAHWSHATNDVYQSAINEQELMSVPAPNDNGSIISFWVPSQSKPASSDHDSFMSFPNGGCAAVCQPVWRPSSRPSQLVVASPTVFCLQFITQKVSPMTSPATIHTQPLLKLALFLVGSPVRDACHPDPHSSFCSYLAARRSTKKAQKAAGFTFCGKPSKLACWLSGVCDHVPGLPISQSHLWALGSGSHIHSAVRTAGLQQLSS